MCLPSGALLISCRDERTDGQLCECDGGDHRLDGKAGRILDPRQHDHRAGVEDAAPVL
jgi:hypothetical protein